MCVHYLFGGCLPVVTRISVFRTVFNKELNYIYALKYILNYIYLVIVSKFVNYRS